MASFSVLVHAGDHGALLSTCLHPVKILFGHNIFLPLSMLHCLGRALLHDLKLIALNAHLLKDLALGRELHLFRLLFHLLPVLAQGLVNPAYLFLSRIGVIELESLRNFLFRRYV